MHFFMYDVHVCRVHLNRVFMHTYVQNPLSLLMLGFLYIMIMEHGSRSSGCSSDLSGFSACHYLYGSGYTCKMFCDCALAWQRVCVGALFCVHSYHNSCQHFQMVGPFIC